MSKKLNKEVLRDILQKQLREALELQKIRSDHASPVELDQTRVGRLSRMDAMQQQEMAKAGLQRITADIKRIELTLNRLDSEDYGYCLKCGDQIDLELLTFNPSIVSCRNCRKSE